MEQPTCESCPFFEFVDENEGQCKNHPPVYTGEQRSDDSSKSATPDAWDFPWVSDGDWCGEHPGFPAYIASLKHEGSSVTPNGV